MNLALRLLIASLVLASLARVSAFDAEEARVRYTVTSWTESDGMPSSYVRAIAQDRDGYLWLATYSGLVRFDGIRFAPWKSRDATSLPSEDLSALLVTRDGSLWVGGFGGVTHLVDGRLDARASSAEGFFSGSVSALFEDRAGHVWAAAQSGIAEFDGTEWRRLGAERGLPERAGQSLGEDSTGTLWIGTSVGLFRRAPHDARFAAVPQISFAVEDLVQNRAGSIVLTHPTGLIATPGGSAITLDDPELRRSHGTRLMLDGDRHLWIGTRGHGLVRVRAGEHSRAFTVDRITKEDGLSADSVLALFEDRERNIWVGTPYGLNRLSQNAILPVPMDRGMTGHVRAVAEGADGTWVATEDSLLHFSGETQTDYGWKKTLPNHTLIALHYDRAAQTLWVSTNQGLVRLKSGVLAPFATAGPGRLSRIRSITTDDHGRLWLCDVDQGVFRSTDRHLTQFELVAGDKLASTVFTARDGRVWVGFIDGTVRSYKDGHAEAFSAQEGLARGGNVTAIHEDRAGTFWVGTHAGLSRYSGGRFVTLTKADGFPGPGPVSIVDDLQGQLWLGVTGLGILQLSPTEFDAAVRTGSHQLKYRLYGPSDGLRGTPVRAFGTPTVARGAGGEMWFLTGNGLSVVDPSRLTAHRPAAPLVIERMLADTREYAPSNGLNLPPHTAALQIDYTLLSLAGPAHVSFRYRLEGFDPDWVDAGARRQAFYTNVPPGSYRFVVEAGGDAPASRSSAEWRFSIEPIFYQTSWFAFACVLASGLAMAGLWQLRLHQVRRRFSLVLDERARMGREIHDTLLQGLVGVAVQFKVIADQLHTSPDAAHDRLERVRKLVEHYVFETRQSIWDLRSPTLEGRDLATALREAGETLATDKNVRFELVVHGKPYACGHKIEEQLLRVGREALSNAVRHAHPGRVRVELDYRADSLCLRVVDDGCGFNRDDPGLTSEAHWGLASMRERAQQINARFQLVSAAGKGTEIELIVPVMRTR